MNFKRWGRFAALSAVLIVAGGCEVQASYSSTPAQARADRYIGSVGGERLSAIDDTSRGVTCYVGHYNTLSCVRVKP